jgi:cation diffusion facilitator family transporter
MSLGIWHDDHAFGQDKIQPAEKRVQIVIVITAITMVIEVYAGLKFGSMALLADGLHMGTHAAALGISALAYAMARKYARDPRFNFGTGKVNALGGITSALMLAFFAVPMAWESIDRLRNPNPIDFDLALIVAVLGLIVNGASVVILDVSKGHSHNHDHGHTHEHDQNLKGAYFHVMADAMTSVLAIFALLVGKYYGWVFMDPMMGIVGAAIILHWAWGLLRTTSNILLDHQADPQVRTAIEESLHAPDDHHIVDLHVWSIGPGIHALELVILAEKPKPPRHYKSLLPEGLGIVHCVIEVHERAENPA